MGSGTYRRIRGCGSRMEGGTVSGLWFGVWGLLFGEPVAGDVELAQDFEVSQLGITESLHVIIHLVYVIHNLYMYNSASICNINSFFSTNGLIRNLSAVTWNSRRTLTLATVIYSLYMYVLYSLYRYDTVCTYIYDTACICNIHV